MRAVRIKYSEIAWPRFLRDLLDTKVLLLFILIAFLAWFANNLSISGGKVLKTGKLLEDATLQKKSSYDSPRSWDDPYLGFVGIGIDVFCWALDGDGGADSCFSPCC